eukprot:5044527-Prymnesium_polylepis.1
MLIAWSPKLLWRESCRTLAVSRCHAADRLSQLAIFTSPPPQLRASLRRVTRPPSSPSVTMRSSMRLSECALALTFSWGGSMSRAPAPERLGS